MARCPYLSLEEYGTEPFPFPSSSHRCYVSTMGLPIGQQEQERYCLTKKYTSCPLFLCQLVEQELPDTTPEPMTRVAGTEVGVEPPAKEGVEDLPTQEGPADKPAEAVVTEISPEPVGAPPLEEKVEPLPSEKVIPSELPPAEAIGEQPSTVAEPSLSRAPQTSAKAMSIVLRVLPWAAAGALFLTFLCVGGVTAARMAHVLPQIHFPSLRLSSLWPGALLLISATSFVVAILLIALLLWTRRSAPE